MDKTLGPLLAAAGSGVLALATAAAAQPAPTDAIAAAPQIAAAPSATLSNGLITARVLLPGEKAFYQGARFDRAGVVSSLTYQGQEFYGPWFGKTAKSVRDFVYDGDEIIAGPHSAITGPVDEFDTAKPLGWDEAGPGGVFVKIGVGALRRPDAEPYAPYRSYEMVDAGKRTLKLGKTSATFTHELSQAGYAYRYEKTLSLPPGQARMVIDHSLRNTGARPITTIVYNHNFLTFGAGGMAEGLTLSAPWPITSSKPSEPPLAALRDGKVVFLKTLETRERVFMPLEGFRADPADNAIRATDGRTGAWVAFQGDRPLTRVQLWSIRSVAAVEPFITLTIAPRSEVRWRYVYDYGVR